MAYKKGAGRPGFLPLLIAALLMGMILIGDLITPLGFAGGVFYVAVILFSRKLPQNWVVLIAGVCSILTVLGYLLSSPGGEYWIVIGNRTLSLFAIWLAAFYAIQAKRGQERLFSLNSELEQRAAERSEDLLSANKQLSQEIEVRKESEERLRLMAESQQELAARSAALGEIGRIIGSSLDTKEVYDRFALEMKQLVDFDRIIINLVDHNRGSITVAFHYGLDVPERTVGTTIQIQGSPIEEAISTRRVVCRGIVEHSEWPGDKQRYQTGLRSVATAPLIVRNVVVGTLGLSSKKESAYGDEERGLLELLASQIAPAVANAELYEQALNSAHTLRQNQEELTRSNADLEQFAYVASHDLQEPLRAVSGFAKLLSDGYSEVLDEAGQRYIARMKDGASRMQELINDLLTYSRIGVEPKVERTYCEELVKSEVASLDAVIQEAGGSVSVGSLPELIADSSLLAQVFRNLISNAIKYHGAEPPCVRIGAEESEGGWTFSVQDNGIGIDPEHNNRIFTIFQRLHTREEYSGTGIGLAICKKAIERLGGRIWLSSEPGQGTTFYFTVPTNQVSAKWSQDVNGSKNPKELAGNRIHD